MSVHLSADAKLLILVRRRRSSLTADLRIRTGPMDDGGRWLMSPSAGLFPPVRGWRRPIMDGRVSR
jgi:hypothetical protein